MMATPSITALTIHLCMFIYQGDVLAVIPNEDIATMYTNRGPNDPPTSLIIKPTSEGCVQRPDMIPYVPAPPQTKD